MRIPIRRMNNLQWINIHELGTIGMFPTKLYLPILLITRFHLFDLHTRFPMPHHISNVIKILLGPAYCNHPCCSELGDTNWYLPWWKSSPHKLVAMSRDQSCGPLLRCSSLFYSRSIPDCCFICCRNDICLPVIIIILIIFRPRSIFLAPCRFPKCTVPSILSSTSLCRSGRLWLGKRRHWVAHSSRCLIKVQWACRGWRWIISMVAVDPTTPANNVVAPDVKWSVGLSRTVVFVEREAAWKGGDCHCPPRQPPLPRRL